LKYCPCFSIVQSERMLSKDVIERSKKIKKDRKDDSEKEEDEGKQEDEEGHCKGPNYF